MDSPEVVRVENAIESGDEEEFRKAWEVVVILTDPLRSA